VDDFERCYRAVQSRDPRFDGWFFTAVTSTGIYCRPSCPALTPRRAHVRFFPTAAAAQHAGFRACLRCRPDAAPGSPEWLGRADVAARAVRLVLDGIVDRQGVAGLAARLGYSERQLHRVLMAEVGTGALAIARAQRAQTARLLVETTDLSMARVAFAAGFASVRQFNDTVKAVFARTPSELRRSAASREKRGSGHRRRVGADTAGATQVLSVRLAHRRPFATAELCSFLARRAVPGVEWGDAGSYRRSLRLPHGAGTVQLVPGDGYLQAHFVLDDLRDLSTAIARCRHLGNLDADPQAVDAALAEDRWLAPLVRDRPGLRVPGSADGFETAVRSVLGQQVSVPGARTLAAALVDAADTPVAPGEGGLRVFPSPEALGALVSSSTALPLPRTRRRALEALCDAVVSGRLVLDAGADSADVTATLVSLPGIGPWTASAVALRALGDPDAFLERDLGTRRAAAALGLPDAPAALAAHAERWRPWRAYAQMHLWTLPGRATPDDTDGRGTGDSPPRHPKTLDKESAA
jgi:AraC family transcriptional regulator of adaptative response / DNA-3-methyladenine glycosylase II